MHERTIVFIIYHAIAIPLFALYVIQLVILKIRAEFSSSFYIFFFFGGIIDLIFYTLNVVFYQLAIQPWMAFLFDRFCATRDNKDWMQYSWMMSIANLIMFYLPGVQDVINLLIATNRFCALCFPFAYRKIFTRTNTYIMLPLGMIYSIVYIFPVIGAFGFAINVAHDNLTEPIYMITVYQTAFPSISMSKLTAALSFTDSGICLILYCIIASWIFKLKRKSNVAEMRMLLLGFSILLTNTPSILYQVHWIGIGWGEYGSYAFQTLPWAILIKTLTPPLLLLSTNEHMRRELTSVLPTGLRPVHSKSTTFEVTTSVVPVITPVQIPRPSH